MVGEKFLDLGVACRSEAIGQLVIGQIRRQRLVAQGTGVLTVRAAVTLCQGVLGFIVVLTLLGEAGGFDAGDAGCGKDQTGNNGEKATAHGISGGKQRYGATRSVSLHTSSLAFRQGAVNAARRVGHMRQKSTRLRLLA
jgi:hypothetical protein